MSTFVSDQDIDRPIRVYETERDFIDSCRDDLRKIKNKLLWAGRRKLLKVMDEAFEDIEDEIVDLYKRMRTRPKQTKSGYIYGLYDPRTWQLKYIGQTTDNLKRRWYGHMGGLDRKMKDPTDKKSEWIWQLKQINLRPIIAPLELADASELDVIERYWIENTSGLLNRNHNNGK